MLKKLRIALGVLFFAGIVVLFAVPEAQNYVGWLAKIQFLPAVMALNLVVVVSILLVCLVAGRWYCSVACPMGVLQDFFYAIGIKVKKNHMHYSKGLPWLRWTMLAVFVVLMVLGINGVAILVAPYSAFGRMANTVFHWQGMNVVACVAMITFVVIAALSAVWGRLWCNTICPVGTVLGTVARFSLLKPYINETKCVHCGRCAKNCKAMCIDGENRKIDYSRCVNCMDCIENCNVGAIQYGRPAKEEKHVDGSRRKFVVTTAAVTAAMALEAQEKKVDGGLAVIEDKQVPERKVPLKPFGAQSLKNFSTRCTGCQLCVSECPSKVLRPSTGLSTLLQPEMAFDKGYCKTDCTRCSEVCPAGAIKKIDEIEKSAISIGHAVTVPQNCLLGQGVACNACSRHCPTGAITLVDDASTGHKVVAVNENTCIGCGACEHLCPVRPFSAIYVEGREVHTTV
ncbi:MAG: 4Fe-4S binding protein [Bacteroidales bacterium]|nr:4Fe-4S binding protein [Bacteroidales bacterium]